MAKLFDTVPLKKEGCHLDKIDLDDAIKSGDKNLIALAVLSLRIEARNNA